jgi:hypothetical protein
MKTYPLGNICEEKRESDRTGTFPSKTAAKEWNAPAREHSVYNSDGLILRSSRTNLRSLQYMRAE